MTRNKGQPLKWFNKRINIDIDTGEILSNQETDNYYLIDTIKNTKVYDKTGRIEFTKRYKRKPRQLELEFTIT